MEDELTLLKNARAGDEAALSLLIDAYAPKILRFARKLCGGAADAEDVMQQTWLTAVDHINDFRGDSQFASWLYAIARSHCIKLRTRGAAAHPAESLEQVEQVVAPPEHQAPDQLASKNQLEMALDVAISTLDYGQREVLLLRDVEGLSASEVAAALGLSVDAVKSRLHRARKALRDQLSPWLEQSSPSPACPDVVDLLSRYQEGDITNEACHAMQAHVDGCPQCAERCHSLRAVLSACGDTPVPTLSPELQAAVRQQIRRSLGRQLGSG